MALISQYADNLRGQRFVEDIDDYFAVAFVAIGHGAVFDVLAGTFTNGLNIADERRLLRRIGFAHDGFLRTAFGCVVISTFCAPLLSPRCVVL
jgi:hypothetical protein